jgi:hypothetical protein
MLQIGHVTALTDFFSFFFDSGEMFAIRVVPGCAIVEVLLGGRVAHVASQLLVVHSHGVLLVVTLDHLTVGLLVGRLEVAAGLVCGSLLATAVLDCDRPAVLLALADSS